MFKKYYAISEVALHLNVSPSLLRRIENNSTDLNIVKIKNRRYYTEQNIIIIKQLLSKYVSSKDVSALEATKELPMEIEFHEDIIEKIDCLLKKLQVFVHCTSLIIR